MALGKKTISSPEVGDLVKVKAQKAFIFDNEDEVGIPEDSPQNANLGAIIAIKQNSSGTTMFNIESGWVSSELVTTSANPNYNYPEVKTKKDNTAVWAAINTAIGGIFGFLNKDKNTSNSKADSNEDSTSKDSNTGDGSEVDGQGGGGQDKKTGTSLYIWIGLGALVLVGGIVALLIPKKDKSQEGSGQVMYPNQKPIILK